jgi:tRNA threonylcarbamoyladenosine biosynthesis protein TsaB
MEVYTALFDVDLNFIEETKAIILDEKFLSDYLSKNNIYFFGDGAHKLKPLLKENEHAIFIDDFAASATGMILLAEKKLALNDFEDIAYFEPFYLKDFVGNQSRNSKS